MQVDIGFGDAVHPSPKESIFPTILDFPAPLLLCYSRESAIAEKLETVALINDRETGRPRGFGFIEVDDADLEGMISALDGKEMGGRALRVNEAQNKPRGGGGGGYVSIG